jgi:hypothetical protein
MNILVAVLLCSVLLLALDLLTAPKAAQTPRARLKDSGRIA